MKDETFEQLLSNLEVFGTPEYFALPRGGCDYRVIGAHPIHPMEDQLPEHRSPGV